MPNEKPQKRPYRQREARLVSEYVLSRWPDNRVWFNQRVGSLPQRILDQDLTPAEQATLGPMRPRIDALVLDNNELICIEGWVLPELGKAGQLRAYLRIIPNTPELGEFAKLPLLPILVGPFDHSLLRAEATDFNITYVVYHPTWIDQVLPGFSGAKVRDRIFDF